MFLVTGATGNVGAELVQILTDRGHQVRALVRAGGRTTVPAGAEVITGDLNRPDTFAAALAGVHGVHLLSGYRDLPEALGAMRRAGVRHVTLQSSSAAPGGDEHNAVAAYHIRSERAMRKSGLAWTFLQPNSFSSNALEWAPQLRAGAVVRAPFAGVPVAVIDPYDVATVAAEALITGAHDGRSYRLSGPEPTLPADRVAVLARVLGRELRFEAQPDDEARVELTAAMPAEYVDAFFSFFVDGTLDESAVLPTVAEVTGREPRSFEQWARAHADEFR